MSPEQTEPHVPAQRTEEPDLSGAATTPAASPLLEVEDLKVHFPIRRGIVVERTVGHVQAVDGVGLSIDAGGTYGLVGESGCGKTTFGRAVLRLEEPTAGRVRLGGDEVTALKGERLRRFRSKMQMVFQDPLGSLNPRHNVDMLLSEPLKVHGVGSKAERRKLAVETLDAVGLPKSVLERFPHEFSGGQRQRLGIARALMLRPDLIVCDEPVSALDVSIQAQVMNLLDELQDEFGLTYLVIAHDLAVVRHLSDRVGVMYLGKLVEEADSETIYENPRHPYTKALLSAVPQPDPEVEATRERIILKGDLPSPANPPSGCRFRTRCPWAEDICAEVEPEWREAASGHKVACHFDL
ncbi:MULTISPECIES: ABC transporter ATP-binding protein [Glycomyces]|uniref:ABC transporter ATP-binding protein n=2 Tax=Glycomyces TaxID=58113 RepID=A0A9X3STT1_9ACTN|nr:ABC transporter ATP-binding protein [Glycomyces lechevalierae]MDA1384119.1 ABC transporter ATP-binding protein [Glycomyces lechevalierae]MDR7339452.1 oligopeptide/dipeptide ABC transporter ATP-binding protein [Glycomyces lechevalierae]